MTTHGRLDGARVLVTGANRGLGAAFVEAAIEAGAERVYAGARDPRCSREPCSDTARAWCPWSST